MKTILHVDMDAFYAAVEQRDDPRLLGMPVIVGGHARRGVVLAASYEVRSFGVRSAMPMAEALRLAPHAIVVPPRRARYEEASANAFAIFRKYTPLVEPLSLDEAFLDVSSSRALFGSGAAIASAIKRDVRTGLSLTASAGVAPCMFAAKVASDVGKPDGLVVVDEGSVAAFLAPLAIERMWGVGPKTAQRLRALGYTRIGDLARADPPMLERAVGRWSVKITRLARGEDDRDVDPRGEPVSVGAERTYDDDLTGRVAVGRTLLEHARTVAQRLVRSETSASTIVLKVKFSDFSLRTRRETLREPVQDTDAIHESALRLLTRVPLEGRRVRLTGVSASGLVPGPPPLTLLPDARSDRRQKLEEVAARIAERFGDDGVVTRASLLPKGR